MRFEKQPIFTARTGGYHVYRIPSIVISRQGTILTTGEARRGTGGDYSANDIVMRRSTDGGDSWSDTRVLIQSCDYGNGAVSNFVPIVDRTSDTIHALYCYDYCRTFYICSTDEGATWSKPREITPVMEQFRRDYPWVVAAVGPGHGLQLTNGRLITSVWLSDGSAHDMGPGHRGHRPSCVGSIYSDDGGASWHRGELTAKTEGAFRHPNETALVELSDGCVLFNIRSESDARRRLISISSDGGHSWSEPYFDPALLEPVCMASLLRLSANEIIFTNPDNLERTMQSCWGGMIREPNCDRKRLTVQLSFDDCRSWACKKIIEAGPSSYSDLAVDREGRIYCLYECGVINGMFDDNYLMLTRFDRDWLTAAASQI